MCILLKYETSIVLFVVKLLNNFIVKNDIFFSLCNFNLSAKNEIELNDDLTAAFFCTGQIILSTLCAFLMKTRKVWLFSAHMLPLLARFCAAPRVTLLTVNTFSMGLTGAGVTVFLLSHLFLPYRLARAAYSELLQLEVLLFSN